MKAVALLLLACIFFLSSFEGIITAAHSSESKACCHKTAQAKNICGSNKKGGEGVPCNPVLACSVCPYVIGLPTVINPLVILLSDKNGMPYEIGSLSYYSNSSWHPPKV